MQKLDASLYPSMFTRQSTRTHSGKTLPEEVLAKIKEYIENLVPMDTTVGYKFTVEPQNDATYRVNAFYDGTLYGNINVGFMLQQLDLYLQTQNIGSLWVGMSGKPKGWEAHKPLEYSICLVFGSPKGKVRRVSGSGFKRKPITDVISDAGLQDVFEPVRLAPSAANRQPWFFDAISDKRIHAYCVQQPFLLERIFKKLNQIDMGIVLLHAALALQHVGFDFELSMLDPAPTKQGYTYIATFNLE